MAPTGKRSSTVFVLFVLVVLLSATLVFRLRRRSLPLTYSSEDLPSLSLFWNLDDANVTTRSSIATVILQPRYFDLATTGNVTLEWKSAVNPYDEGQISFQRTASRSRIMGGRRLVTWEGVRRTIDAEDSTQIATLMHDSGGGRFQSLTGSFATIDASFSITTLSNGEIQIERTPWNNFPSSADVDLSDLMMERSSSEVLSSVNLSAAIFSKDLDRLAAPIPRRRRRRLDEEESMNTIDLLVLVTRRASCEFDRQDSDCDVNEETAEPMDRRLALSVEQTNAALEYGGVNARIRLVEVIYLESDFDGRSTVRTLDVLAFSDDANTYRDDAGADLIMMVTGRHPENCGIAILDAPVSAVGYDCFGSYTFSHEIGHNFGANHERENTPDNQIHPYGHGFAFDDEFHTIMAYSCEDSFCPVVPYFSARNQELPDGRSLGDREHDNVRIMKENAAAMANWRDTVVDDTPDPAPPSDTIIDQELDCPRSRRCGDNEASFFMESDDGECEELCVCREDCKATEVALWVAYTFAGFECGEC